LPAVNAAREAGRRTQCQNNMRNVGLGLIGFATAKNYFPNAGSYVESPTVDVVTPDPTTSYINTVVSNPGNIKKAGGVPMFSWVVEILPYIDNQDLYNAWSKNAGYLDATIPANGGPNNLAISRTAIGILRCPDDNSAQPGNGNLSYAVNGGFQRWHTIPYSWTGFQADNTPAAGGPSATILNWSLTSGSGSAKNWQTYQGVCQKQGLMFQGTILPGGSPGNTPWDVRTTLSAIVDGASSTLMLGENTLAGFSTGGTLSGGFETNWACPFPTYSTFIASDSVCYANSAAGDCSSAGLASSGLIDGPGWAFANSKTAGTFENINYGQQNLTLKGTSPYVNSGHPSGANFVFTDGAVRFISDSIDGTVYSKIITPQGSRMPGLYKQLPVNQDAFAQ
jgi:prepilin-type processing-associated H-X9-DG protein